MLDTVSVPEQFEPIFRKAQDYVRRYFGEKKEDPSKGKIEIFGQRYILVRAASMSVDFFDTIKDMFKDLGDEKASEITRSLLFDVAHAIGKMDAKNFHQKMGVQDPIEKLSAGPIHFAHTGWAFVDISAESRPTPDENYYLIYDHPFSFEADAWEKNGKKSTFCVCAMNAGYSSGWCEESFGIPLVASEIMCKAKGDSTCRFIMAHPSKINQYLQDYLQSHPDISGNAALYRIGGFFQERKQAEQRQAQLLEQLEKTNQELKNFAYIVSHDLKAPLRGIKTLAEWISADCADKLDDNGKEQMNLLMRRANRMHNLIDGILRYSRIGRIEKEKVVVNLNELVTEIIDMIAPPENVTITIENTLPAIECDPTRIMQVFQNLLSNAVKYIDKPKGQIKVDCVEEDGFWKFSVADNGPGIEEKHFGKIFQLFQTLAPRDECESTGIGLTVIKKIVELYNGRIWVQSKVGEGSTFFFTLPKQNIGAKKNEELIQAGVVG
ncbi:MAG: ATP-binding protein [Phycisphaerae bacterium]|nr:ATP-binding protein [Phycisphaerae bacterium]MDD5380944.1 ATP-binding protein [Phycisphaerae bacterium]